MIWYVLVCIGKVLPKIFMKNIFHKVLFYLNFISDSILIYSCLIFVILLYVPTKHLSIILLYN